MKKETIFNLQNDWDGILQWYGVHDEQSQREIKRLIALEVDSYQNQPLWARIINKTPDWNPFK